MKRTALIVAGLALLMLSLPTQSRADACPPIGFASGCDVVITLTGGTITTTITGVGPYDGVEDQLVGVVNNSGGTLNSLTLSGSFIFGFDGDGAASSNCTLGAASPNGCPFSGFGPTGYEGPNTSFSIVDFNNGTVFFTGGLPNGSTAWFSLEEPASLQGFTVTGTNSVPEPSSFLFLGMGMVALAGLALRRAAA